MKNEIQIEIQTSFTVFRIIFRRSSVLSLLQDAD